MNSQAEKIFLEMFSDFKIPLVKVHQLLSKEFHVSQEVFQKYLDENFTQGQRKERQRICAMTNRVNLRGKESPRWKDRILEAGYWFISKPIWWTGTVTKVGKAPEHQVVYCQENNLTEIPLGYVVHHKDEDPLNNDPSNLEMMPRAEHTRLHNQIWCQRGSYRSVARPDQTRPEK